MIKLAVWHGDPAQNGSSVAKAMEAFLGPQPILLYIPSLRLRCSSSESRASSPLKFTSFLKNKNHNLKIFSLFLYGVLVIMKIKLN